jgi:hypothetical protein
MFTGSLALGIKSYRALRFPWNGHPETPPAIAVAARSSGRASVWASWNGATNVAAWRVRGGPSCNAGLVPMTKVSRSGFETRITLNHPPACVDVQALNGQGKVLGTSTADQVGQSPP